MLLDNLYHIVQRAISFATRAYMQPKNIQLLRRIVSGWRESTAQCLRNLLCVFERECFLCLGRVGLYFAVNIRVLPTTFVYGLGIELV